MTTLTEGLAYAHGYNCGLNGPNETNSHFTLFATPQLTVQWEKGKRAGEASRANELARPKRKREAKI